MGEIILKPCPFCGASPQWIKLFVNKSQKASYELQCMDTECRVNPCTDLHETPQEAADAWNTRRE